ncbi:MAG: beta-propeller domain-containing protein [Polyangiaceae bacterium]
MPGFSTYMHPLDDNHLLALGYEADDHGDFAYFNGIQLQIFDVTNPTVPALLHKKVFGTRGSSSSALTDHLGFTFLPDRKLLTLPMSICEGGGDGSYGTLDFSGVVALRIDAKDGIQELGRLEEPYPANVSGFYYGGACSDWWTDSNSVVKRTVVLDDFPLCPLDRKTPHSESDDPRH